MTELKKKVWCSARDCQYQPVDGWIYVTKRNRRHRYCPTHDQESADDHKTYKTLETKHVFVTFQDADIKRAIALRQQWAQKYLRKDECSDKAHPAFVRLLESLLKLPQEKRATAVTKMLYNFIKYQMR